MKKFNVNAIISVSFNSSVSGAPPVKTFVEFVASMEDESEAALREKLLQPEFAEGLKTDFPTSTGVEIENLVIIEK